MNKRKQKMKSNKSSILCSFHFLWFSSSPLNSPCFPFEIKQRTAHVSILSIQKVSDAVALVGQFLYSQSNPAGYFSKERSLRNQKEMQTWERHKVDTHLPQVCVQLIRESDRSS